MQEATQIGSSTELEWEEAQATVSACKLRRVSASMSEPNPSSEYAVTFFYEVGGRAFRGDYRTNTPVEAGHRFEILYDPEQPYRHSGCEVDRYPVAKWVLRSLAIAMVCLALWVLRHNDWLSA